MKTRSNVMKRLCHSYLSVLVLLVVVGCASAPAKFNETYLPNAIPDKPNELVTFEPDINKAIAQYARKPDFSNVIELFWFEANNLYLNLEGSAVYLINPSTKNVEKLNAAEREPIKAMISKKINITNTAKEAGLARKVASYLFSSLGQQYSGEIIDNNNKWQVNVETNMKRSDNADQVCASAKLIGKLTDDKGKKLAMQWDFNCEWLPQTVADYKVPQILRRLQISPSGKYYLYGGILYRTDRSGAGVDLIANYSNVISISANPDWTKIAILRGTSNKYWIEIFNFRVAD
jgi:hypothetical protein